MEAQLPQAQCADFDLPWTPPAAHCAALANFYQSVQACRAQPCTAPSYCQFCKVQKTTIEVENSAGGMSSTLRPQLKAAISANRKVTGPGAPYVSSNEAVAAG